MVRHSSGKLLLCLTLCLVLSVLSVSVSALSAHSLITNDELRDQRLQNLAETIAELKIEAEDEREHERATHMRTLVEIHQAPATSNSTSSSASPARSTPKYQGTNKRDLVALYRFDDARNPGRAFGGPDRRLKVFGEGISIVNGTNAKRGRGALRISQNADSSAAAYLARSDKGKAIPGLPTNDASFTIASWFKVAEGSRGKFSLLSWGGSKQNEGNQFKVTGRGRAISSFRDGDSFKSNNTADLVAGSKWHHAAVTFDKASLEQRIYIDGNLAGVRTASQPKVEPSNFFVGIAGVADNSTGVEQFYGTIDDLAIFNVPLNSEEITTIMDGNFIAYLDLFSLRKCRTRVGRRNHGAGFKAGHDFHTVSIDDQNLKYGFRTKNAFKCASRCARTTNCRQAVFQADNSTIAASPSSAPGRCFLMSKGFRKKYDADKNFVSTVCRAPSKRLQKRSFTMKVSKDFDAQQARKAKYQEEQRIKKERERQQSKEQREAQEKRIRELREAERKQQREREQRRQEREKHEDEKHKAREERRNAVEGRSDAASSTSTSSARGASNSTSSNVDSDIADKNEVTRLRLKALKTRLTAQFSRRLKELKSVIDRKESEIKDVQRQAQHKNLISENKSARVIARLTKRLKKLETTLESKEKEQKLIALASKIKMEADQKANEIVAEAASQAKEVKRKVREARRRKMRQAIEDKLDRAAARRRKNKKNKKGKKGKNRRRSKKAKKLTKAQKAAAKARKRSLAAMAKAEVKRAKRRAAKQAKKAAAKKRRAAAAARKAAKSGKKAKKKQTVKANKAGNGGL
jgi:colicin import membrane protein